MVIYNCEMCNFNTKYKNDYNRHLNTKKHKNNQDIYQAEEKQKDTKGLKKTQKGLKNSNFSKKRTQKRLKRTQN